MKKITKLFWLGIVLISSISYAQPARLQVVHNSPDLAAATVDVYVNDVLLLDNFEFRTATPFIDVPASVSLSIDVAPSTSTSSAEGIFNLTTTLAAGETYIIVANGIVSATGYSVAPNFNLNVYALGREAATSPTNTDVLVNHGSPDAPTVDVVETSIPAGIIVDDISFPEFRGYLELPTGDYVLDIRDETGTVTVASYQAPLETLGLDGAALMVLASGFLDPSQNSDGPAFGLWVALPTGGALIPLPAVEMPMARLQVVHNSPDLAVATVDVYVNDELLLDNFEFRTATPFIDVPAGVSLSIDVAPSTSSSSAEGIFNLTATLAAGETYIIVANGIVSATGYSVAPNFNLNVYALGREEATSPTNTDVLVNHGSPDAPTVDVVETSAPAGTIVDNISFPEFRGYLELPTADYVLDIRDETGTVTVASYQALLQTLGLDGAALMVLASGFLDPSQNSNGPAFGLWVALPTGGALIPLPPSLEMPMCRLQVVHNSPDLAAATVDVYVNDVLLLDNFAFRTATPFIDVPAGVELSVDIAPATSTSSAQSIYNLTATLEDGETYIIVANGIVSTTGYSVAPNFDLNVYALGREAATSPTNTDVLVNHGSPDAPTVDVVETSIPAGTIVDNISFPEFRGYLELPTGDYVLDIRNETGTATVESYEAPLQTLGLDGAALMVLASGFLNPSQNSNGPAFGLWVALPTGGALIELPLFVEMPMTARLQVVHNSPDLAAATVDVYVNDELLLDNFAFRTATPFIDVEAGVSLSIDVAPSTSSSSAEGIFNLTATLEDGETYIIVANGIVSATGYSVAPNFDLNVYALGREAATSPTNTDVLVNHGSPDAPTVDVVETSVPAGTIVDNISFPEFRGYLELQTADYVIDIRDETGTATVASYQAPLETLGLDGAALMVLASGFLDPSQNSNGPAFGLWVALPTGGALIPLPSVPLSVGDFNVDKLALYPNPTAGEINLAIPFAFNSFDATIYDVSGRTVKKVNTPFSIDVSDFTSGVYMIDSEIDGRKYIQKFVKH